MAAIDCTKVPETVWVDLCTVAIMQTAAALATPEGKAAVQKGVEKYKAHLAQIGKCAADLEDTQKESGLPTAE